MTELFEYTAIFLGWVGAVLVACCLAYGVMWLLIRLFDWLGDL